MGILLQTQHESLRGMSNLYSVDENVGGGDLEGQLIVCRCHRLVDAGEVKVRRDHVKDALLFNQCHVGLRESAYLGTPCFLPFWISTTR